MVVRNLRRHLSVLSGCGWWNKIRKGSLDFVQGEEFTGMTIVRLLALGALFASTIFAHAQSAEQMKQMAITGAKVSGGVARIAIDVCQIQQTLVDAYKEMARNAYTADDSFEGDWIIGWNSQQPAVDDILKLQANALQKSHTCARIRYEMKL